MQIYTVVIVDRFILCFYHPANIPGKVFSGRKSLKTRSPNYFNHLAYINFGSLCFSFFFKVHIHQT